MDKFWLGLVGLVSCELSHNIVKIHLQTGESIDFAMSLNLSSIMSLFPTYLNTYTRLSTASTVLMSDDDRSVVKFCIRQEEKCIKWKS